jgi:hypothetical protein
MADNYLITGYHGEPHVTAENDRGINAGTFGAGRFVLPVGEQFRAEYIGNNTIRLFDGKLMDNGAAAGIPAGEFIDLLISNAGQGMNRNDLIVFQYAKDDSTAVESGSFVVIQGTETSGTAADPELTQEDLLTNNATFDQMALWRVSVSGATISAPVQMFSVSQSIGDAGNNADYITEQGTSGIYSYRKWKSGVKECWCTASVTRAINSNSVVNGIVVSTYAIYGSYPSGLFTEIPSCRVELLGVKNGGTEYNGWLYAVESGTAQATPKMQIARIGTAIESATVTFSVYAIGK